MDCIYWVEGDDVWVADRVTGQVTWHGKPEGDTALTVLSVPGSCDGIVLLDWMKGPKYTFQNLIRCRPDGSVVWRAKLPQRSHDFYTEARWEDHHLMAYSWSGCLCDIDPATGGISTARFVK